MGSIEDIAASTGLDPLFCGIVEAICDLRLDGIAALTLAETGCDETEWAAGGSTGGCGWSAGATGAGCVREGSTLAGASVGFAGRLLTLVDAATFGSLSADGSVLI